MYVCTCICVYKCMCGNMKLHIYIGNNSRGEMPQQLSSEWAEGYQRRLLCSAGIKFEYLNAYVAN